MTRSKFMQTVVITPIAAFFGIKAMTKDKAGLGESYRMDWLNRLARAGVQGRVGGTKLRKMCLNQSNFQPDHYLGVK